MPSPHHGSSSERFFPTPLNTDILTFSIAEQQIRNSPNLPLYKFVEFYLLHQEVAFNVANLHRASLLINKANTNIFSRQESMINIFLRDARLEIIF